MYHFFDLIQAHHAVSFINERFSSSDEAIKSHPLANAMLSTKDRRIFLKELVKDGRLGDDLIQKISTLTGRSDF